MLAADHTWLYSVLSCTQVTGGTDSGGFGSCTPGVLQSHRSTSSARGPRTAEAESRDRPGRENPYTVLKVLTPQSSAHCAPLFSRQQWPVRLSELSDSVSLVHNHTYMAVAAVSRSFFILPTRYHVVIILTVPKTPLGFERDSLQTADSRLQSLRLAQAMPGI